MDTEWERLRRAFEAADAEWMGAVDAHHDAMHALDGALARMRRAVDGADVRARSRAVVGLEAARAALARADDERVRLGAACARAWEHLQDHERGVECSCGA